MSSSRKYIFVLKNIDNPTIDRRFGIVYNYSLDSSLETDLPTNITFIDDLVSSKKNSEVISFLNESKKMIKCNVSMIDVHTNKPNNASNTVAYHCFWCRHSIPSNCTPIGCPLKFVPHQAVKTYYSEISKDNYTIRENITESTITRVKNMNDPKLSIIEKGHYITDGVFCSFNCCKAYINDNKTNSEYKDSYKLLLKMYNDITQSEINEIEPAHHWRTLKVYGGNLSIESFRESFGKVEYLKQGVYIKTTPIGILFEEKVRF